MQADLINISLGTDYSHLLPEGVREEDIPHEVIEKMQSYVIEANDLYMRPLATCFKKGISVITSAGNDSLSVEHFPLASASHTICVGALDRNNMMAAFSNYGQEVSCYAPGVEISVVSPSGELRFGNGTSFSAPYVTGIISIAKELKPNITIMELQKSLKQSNLEVRGSLFPDGKIQLFSPILFLESLGVDFKNKSQLNNNKIKFSRQFEKWFIDDSDSDQEKMEKILGFYKRRRLFSENEKEGRWAIDHADNHFEYLLKKASRMDKNYDFYAAKVLAEAQLTNIQKQQVLAAIPTNDMIAIIVFHHEIELAIPLFKQRLKEPSLVFNGNTLFGLRQMSGNETLPDVTHYLKRIHQTDSFTWDEGITCYTMMSKMPKVSSEAKKLLSISLNRYRKIDEPFLGSYLARALVLAGEKEGIQIMVNQIRQLDNLEDCSKEGEIRKVQLELNYSIESDHKFDYDDPLEIRNKNLKYLLDNLNKATYKNKKFHF